MTGSLGLRVGCSTTFTFTVSPALTRFLLAVMALMMAVCRPSSTSTFRSTRLMEPRANSFICEIMSDCVRSTSAALVTASLAYSTLVRRTDGALAMSMFSCTRTILSEVMPSLVSIASAATITMSCGVSIGSFMICTL